MVGGIVTPKKMAEVKPFVNVNTAANLLDEIEIENLYQALLTVAKRTLQILLLKIQGYSTKEIASTVHLTTGGNLRKVRPSSRKAFKAFPIITSALQTAQENFRT